MKWIGVVENFSPGVGVTKDTYPTYSEALEGAKSGAAQFTEDWRFEGPMCFAAYREDLIPSQKERRIAKAIRQMMAEQRSVKYMDVNTERMREERDETQD
jgi:hypothetical protein